MIMKLFISHSLASTDQYVASLLTQQARSRGLIVSTSHHTASSLNVAESTLQSIKHSDMVIAIVSRDSQYTPNVQIELGFAVAANRPVLALIEQGTSPISQVARVRYVYFNRYNLSPAMAEISRILEEHKSKEDTNKWLIAGGLALLALYLVGENEQSE